MNNKINSSYSKMGNAEIVRAEKIWYKLFGGEKRAFIHWYIVMYIISVTHHEYHSIMHFFSLHVLSGNIFYR